MSGIHRLVDQSYQAGERLLARRSIAQRKELGQFLTPPEVARYMARHIGRLRKGDRILDPCIGSGVLACAVVEQAVLSGEPLELSIDGYEVDPELAQLAEDVLAQASVEAARSGVKLHAQVHTSDFILAYAPKGPLFDVWRPPNLYDHIIANPPYLKLNREDPRVRAVAGLINGHTNAYTLFMMISLRLLRPTGQACFIVPRSFCSGAYFSAFRRDFARQAVPIAVHLFASRDSVFERNDVLQENVILAFGRRQPGTSEGEQAESVSISVSGTTDELAAGPCARDVPASHFYGRRNGDLFFRLPTDWREEAVLGFVDRWDGSLEKYGLAVSTGPVVAFRARSHLSTDMEAVRAGRAVPLLWMQNVRAQRIEWPTVRGGKPQAISVAGNAGGLLLPLRNYVLLRRFSAKEERRRLVAAPLLAARFGHPCRYVGLENHLNYVYREHGDLSDVEAEGLSALLNTELVDLYFRVMNGNTQVNATDLRALPLPPIDIIQRVGQALIEAGQHKDMETVALCVLQQAGYVPVTLTSVPLQGRNGQD